MAIQMKEIHLPAEAAQKENCSSGESQTGQT